MMTLMVTPGRSPFDPPLDEMQAMGAAAVDFASRFIDERYTAPASDYDGLDSLLPDLAQRKLAVLVVQVDCTNRDLGWNSNGAAIGPFLAQRKIDHAPVAAAGDADLLG